MILESLEHTHVSFSFGIRSKDIPNNLCLIIFIPNNLCQFKSIPKFVDELHCTQTTNWSKQLHNAIAILDLDFGAYIFQAIWLQILAIFFLRNLQVGLTSFCVKIPLRRFSITIVGTSSSFPATSCFFIRYKNYAFLYWTC